MTKTQNLQITYASVWELAGPNVISNILMVAVPFAHLWIVSPLGPEISAAVVAGGRINFLLMSAVMALSVATTALVARAWGAENAKEASSAMSASLWMTFYLSIFLAFPTYLTAPWVASIFNLDPHTTKEAIAYIRPLAFVNGIFAFILSITTAFRAIGDVIRPMKYTALTTVLSIVFSYAAVHGILVPELGVSGIPIGTGVGHLFSLIPYFFFIWRKKYKLHFTTGAYKDGRNIRQLIKIGMPAAIEQAIIQTSFIVFLMIVSDFGTAAFAAYGIGITILSVCIVVGLGIGAASSTLTGQALGAKNYIAAYSAGWKSMRLAIFIMSVLALGIFLMKTPLAALLSADNEVRDLTEFFIIILAVIQPLMGIEFAIGGALRGAGDTKYPLYVSLAGILFGRLALGIIVIATNGTVELLYSVIIVDYAIKAALLVQRFRGNAWLQIGEKHIPAAVQSEAGVSREAVRSYYRGHSSKSQNADKTNQQGK
ncbi:MATE family efflux transporter [Kordiimonas sediminis]|uniref:Multidrug-efflux transporter n=1 Tax=Kordiimonas sediminis TaxID=1735581 RepID=A0A919AUH6_9PROT|nr:MATE family efflux transporter [Kordiimonas sediminis]GHF26746.1 MATE family efflux transporter [Kordiimonas sediminis]